MNGVLFDSHCHVHDPRLIERAGGLDAAIAAARDAGVTALVTVGCDRASSEAAIEAATTHRVTGVEVFATVGLHPHDAVDGVDSLGDLFDRPGVVAVGECGLDYYYDHSPREVQRRAFAEQIAIAHARGMPLVIHTRDAWDDTFAVLAGEGVPERTIFHCFTGGPDHAERCLAIGAYLSYSGIVTFKRSDDLRAAAMVTPLDRMLVETDAPYLAPMPFRGKPNQPAYVAHTAQFLADLRDLPVAELAAATTGNARRAFALDSV